MHKSDAISLAMTMLNEHETLLPGTHEYDGLVDLISLLIDQLGQEKALELVRKAKLLLMEQVHQDRHRGTFGHR